MDLYTTENNTNRGELFAKIGYVFPEKKYKSVGLQLSANVHDQNQRFGKTTYSGNQQNGYANLIYQSIIGNTNHKYRVGLSTVWDKYIEDLSVYQVSSSSTNGNNVINQANFPRIEFVPGVFGEYTWTPSPKLSLVGGLRIDQHNLFGTQITPRLHGKYDFTENARIRFSAGRGFRTANIIADNIGYYISSRTIVLETQNDKSFPYGINTPEIAWNYGFSLSKDFKLEYRKGNITLDVYRTYFEKQVVADIYASATQLKYLVLNGNSYANSFQIEADYELQKRLDVRVAYRFYDIQTKYENGWEQRPFISKHRFFVNMAYETRSKWKFDATVNWNGAKRLPQTVVYATTYSPSFVTLNAQISKSFGNEQKHWFDVYIGSENLTNYRQDLAIINATNPYNLGFDAAQVYAPITGAMFYIGGRYKWK
jgi:hypothetical protein